MKLGIAFFHIKVIIDGNNGELLNSTEQNNTSTKRAMTSTAFNATNTITTATTTKENDHYYYHYFYEDDDNYGCTCEARTAKTKMTTTMTTTTTVAPTTTCACHTSCVLWLTGALPVFAVVLSGRLVVVVLLHVTVLARLRIACRPRHPSKLMSSEGFMSSRTF